MRATVERVKRVDLGELTLTKEEESIMRDCIRTSHQVWIGRIDGKLAAVWGLVPPTFLSVRAYLWLYTTDVIKTNEFLFIRHSQRVMELLLKDYEYIQGHVLDGSDKSKRWLKWLGATFEPAFGPLIPFTIVRNHG